MDKIEIREEYISGNIFRVGDLVEDLNTGEILQILDRGSNYITVQEASGQVNKKWLNDVKPSKYENTTGPFISEGQLIYHNNVSENFNTEISELFVEQFEETSDLFAWRHAAYNFDNALAETDLSKRYEYLERAEKFFENMGVDTPLYLIVEKTRVEQMRIAEMIAAIAEIEPTKNPDETVRDSIAAMKKANLSKKEWMITHNIFKAARSAGINFTLSSIPHIGITESTDDKIWDLIDTSIDEIVDSIDEEDLLDAFIDEEMDSDDLSEEELNEVLSISGRNRLASKFKRRSDQVAVKRQKKLARGASTADLQRRARKLALSMLKRRMFRKPSSNLSRGEKERFERGAKKRKQVVDKLAARLLNKVRMLQKQRMSK